MKHADSVFPPSPTRFGRRDLTVSLDTAYRYHVPADEQQFEHLRKSFPLLNNDNSASDCEIRDENRCDDSAVLRFLRQAPKAVKLLSAALHHPAGSLSPQRVVFTEGGSDEEYPSRSRGEGGAGGCRGRNGIIDGSRGRGRILFDDDHGTLMGEQRTIMMESEDVRAKSIERERERDGSDVNKHAPKNDVDKLCGEFHSLLSLLGGSVNSDSTYPLDLNERIVAESYNHSDERADKGGNRDVESSREEIITKPDERILGMIGESLKDFPLVSAIQSMSCKHKGCQSEGEVGVIQNEISAHIRQLYMERAADISTVRDTAHTPLPVIFPSSSSSSSVSASASSSSKIAGQFPPGLTGSFIALVDCTSHQESDSHRGQVPITSVPLHDNISAPQLEVGGGRGDKRGDNVSEEREVLGSSIHAVQSQSSPTLSRSNQNPLMHSESHSELKSELELDLDLDLLPVCSHGPKSELRPSLIQISEEGGVKGEEMERGMNVSSDQVSCRNKMDTSSYFSCKDDSASPISSSAHVPTFRSVPRTSDIYDPVDFTFGSSSGSSSGSLNSPSIQGVALTTIGNVTDSFHSVEDDLNSYTGSEDHSAEEYATGSTDYRLPNENGGRDMSYQQRYEERMVGERERHLRNPDERSVEGGSGPRSVDVKDTRVDIIASCKDYSQPCRDEEDYWEMKSDYSSNRCKKNMRGDSKVGSDDGDSDIEDKGGGCRGRVEGATGNERDAAYFSDDSLASRRKDRGDRVPSYDYFDGDAKAERKDGLVELRQMGRDREGDGGRGCDLPNISNL